MTNFASKERLELPITQFDQNMLIATLLVPHPKPHLHSGNHPVFCSTIPLEEIPFRIDGDTRTDAEFMRAFIQRGLDKGDVIKVTNMDDLKVTTKPRMHLESVTKKGDSYPTTIKIYFNKAAADRLPLIQNALQQSIDNFRGTANRIAI